MPYTPAVTPPGDLDVNAFQSAGAGLASQVEGYTIYERPIPQQMMLFERHVNYVGFAMILKAMGFTMGCSTPTTGHYESPWKEDLIKVGDIITPSAGPGTNVVIELDADNMYDTSMTSGGTPVQTSYAQEKDVVELYDRTQVYIVAKNTAVTPHQLTLRPLKAAVDLAGKITVGDEYGILHNLHAEASGLPKGRQPRIVTYSNEFGVIKHVFGSTGFELTNAVYHETLPGVPGSAGESIYIKIKDDELYRYEMSKSHMLLFGQTADNLVETVPSTGLDTPIHSTEGFVDFALLNGTIDTYTPGTYTLDDFDEVANIYYDLRSTKDNQILGWQGPDIATELENVFINVLQQNLNHVVGNIIPDYGSYAPQYHETIGDMPRDHDLTFGYQAIKKNGFVFHLKRLSEFNDIRRVGSDNYSYRGYQIFTPYGWVNDSLSGNPRSTVGYEYKELRPYSRENVVGSLAGAGVGGSNTPFGQAVHQYDTIENFIISHCAGHFAVSTGVVSQIPA